MKSKLVFSILLLALILGPALALSPGSSDSKGAGKDAFTTADTVYFANKASILCGEDLIWKQNVTYYIIPAATSVNSSVNLSSIAVKSGEVYINTDNKISTTIIWESPQAGSWDLVIDLNKNDKYDTSCPDIIDDLNPVGFGVTETSAPAEEQQTPDEETSTANTTENTTQNTTEPAANASGTVTQDNQTTGGSTTTSTGDYTPFIILGIAIVVAAGIIAWTLRTMR